VATIAFCQMVEVKLDEDCVRGEAMFILRDLGLATLILSLVPPRLQENPWAAWGEHRFDTPQYLRFSLWEYGLGAR
jgi:hypothetical protein